MNAIIGDKVPVLDIFKSKKKNLIGIWSRAGTILSNKGTVLEKEQSNWQFIFIIASPSHINIKGASTSVK